MDYEARYKEYQQAIEKYLNGLFTGDVAYGRLYEAMRYAILGGGKRIRPVLTTCAGASPPATRPTARRWPSWRATLCSRRRSG